MGVGQELWLAAWLTLVVKQSGGHKVMGQWVVVIGLQMGHGSPEKGHIVLNGGLDHGLMNMTVGLPHLRTERREE